MPGDSNSVALARVSGRRHVAPHLQAGGDPVAGLAAMRMIGPVGSYRELGVQDHLCWVHGDRRDYRPGLSDFSATGWNEGFGWRTWALRTPGSCESFSAV
jgi:hypothetical protein